MPAARAPRHPALRELAVLAVLAAAAWGGRAGAAADGFAARATIGWEETRIPDLRSSGLTQRYEGSFGTEVVPRFLDYRLSLALTAQDGITRMPAGDSTTRIQEAQPRLVLRSRSELHAATLSYDASLARTTSDPGDEARRLVQRFYLTGDLTTGAAPRLSLFASHARARDLGTGAEGYTSTADLASGQSLGALSWSAGLNWRGSSTNRSDAVQNVYAPRAGVGYQGPLGRSSLAASWAVTYLRTEVSSSGLPTSQAVFLAPSRALQGVNPLPADDGARPLSPAAALTDGNLEVPTGIALGLDGASFQNLALDMGQFLAVDEVDVVVRNASGFLVPQGGPVSWAAWSSADGLRWDPVVGASSLFDPVQSRYVIQFPPTTSRYFKVVNGGLNDTPTYVTEVQGFEHREVSGRRTLVDGSVSQQANLRLAAPIADKVAASADAHVGHAVVGLHTGAPTTQRGDWQASAGLSFGPHGIATYGLSYGHTGVLLAAGPSAATDAASASASFAFLPTLEAHAGTGYSTARLGEVFSRSLSVSAGASATPSGFASFRLEGGVGEQDVTPSEVTSTFWNAQGTAALVLTRSLHVNAQGSIQQGRIRIPDPSGHLNAVSQISNYRQLTLGASFSPSASLALSASAYLLDTGEQSGVLQAYRVYWYPLPGGAFTLNLGFDQGFDTITGHRTSRASVLGRWQLNPQAALDAIYTATGDETQRFGAQQRYGVALSVFL